MPHLRSIRRRPYFDAILVQPNISQTSLRKNSLVKKQQTKGYTKPKNENQQRKPLRNHGIGRRSFQNFTGSISSCHSHVSYESFAVEPTSLQRPVRQTWNESMVNLKRANIASWSPASSCQCNMIIISMDILYTSCNMCINIYIHYSILTKDILLPQKGVDSRSSENINCRNRPSSSEISRHKSVTINFRMDLKTCLATNQPQTYGCKPKNMGKTLQNVNFIILIGFEPF